MDDTEVGSIRRRSPAYAVFKNAAHEIRQKLTQECKIFGLFQQQFIITFFINSK